MRGFPLSLARSCMRASASWATAAVVVIIAAGAGALAARADEPLWDPSGVECGDKCQCGPGSAWPMDTLGPADAVPMGGWIGLYVRGGPAIPLGNNPFTRNHDAGVAVQAGVRQRLTRDPCEYMFFELGGSFLSTRGERTEDVYGNVTTVNALTQVTTTTQVSPLYQTTLLDVRRAGIDIGIGSYFNPWAYVGYPSNRLRGVVRGGGRFGTIWGRFHDVASAQLISVTTPLQQAGQTYTTNAIYEKHTTFGGLFGAAGLDYILEDPSCCSARRFTTIGADVEYSHDWFDFKGFSNNGLDALSLMAHLTVLF